MARMIFLAFVVFSGRVVADDSSHLEQALAAWKDGMTGKVLTFDYTYNTSIRPISFDRSPLFGADPESLDAEGTGEAEVTYFDNDHFFVDQKFQLEGDEERFRCLWIPTMDEGLNIIDADKTNGQMSIILTGRDVNWLSSLGVRAHLGLNVGVINGGVPTLWNRRDWRLIEKTDSTQTLECRFGDVKQVAELSLVDGKWRVVRVQAEGNSEWEGKPYRSESNLVCVYDGDSSVPRQTIIERDIQYEGSSDFQVHRTFLKSISTASPIDRPGDVIKDIDDGTSIQNREMPGIMFEWRDGEVVRRVDRKRIGDLAETRFRNGKWLVPLGALAFVIAFVAYNVVRKKS